jgi:serine/threonine protein kinase
MFVDDNPNRTDFKLADFGLARALDRRTITQAVSDEKEYASAPETFSGVLTEQSDIWSVGVICYILLARKAPFSGE